MLDKKDRLKAYLTSWEGKKPEIPFQSFQMSLFDNTYSKVI